MELLRNVESLHHLRSLELAFHQCLNSAYVGYTTQQSSLDRSQKCRFALEEIPLKIDEAARTLGESGQSFEGLDMDSEMDNLDSLQISFGKLNAIWHLLEVLAYSPTQQLSADFTAWLKVCILMSYYFSNQSKVVFVAFPAVISSRRHRQSGQLWSWSSS